MKNSMDFSRLRKSISNKLAYLNPSYMNAASTLKTSLGFMGTFIERWLPTRLRADSLASIFNYIPLSSSLATSGQPTEAQLAAVKAAGFQCVINLAPHGLENSLPDEAGLVTALGMDYVHIPVDFKNPTDGDFAAFCNAMAQANDQNVLVHCAANMRVSAFMYRYRTQVLKEDTASAQQDLQRIWKPFGVWTDFIDRPGPTQ
jgi:uncharacterized protein (TIGR01244 family)